MKKLLVMLLMVTTLIIGFAVSANAEVSVTFELEEDGNIQDLYKIVVYLKDTEATFRTLQTVVQFDNTIIEPALRTNGTIISSIGNNAFNTYGSYAFLLKSVEVTDPILGLSQTYSITSAGNIWNINGANSSVKLDTKYENFDIYAFDTSSGLDVYAMYFKFANGKSVADLTEDSFKIDSVSYGNGNSYDYGRTDEGLPDTITVTNNVIPTPPAALTVPVIAGDIIYLQDGTKAVAEVAGDYEISRDDGYVTVNTVDTVNNQTAQKVYKVEDGSVAEQTVLANAVLSTSGAQLRDDAKATGIRFKSSFLTSIKSLVSEYGFLVTVESEYNMNKNNLTAGYELTYDLVGAGAVKGIAYNASNDIFYDVDGVRTIVTAVATGIPLTKENVTTNISARPYYILQDGTVVYGETTTRQIYEVAKQIKENADQTTYNAYKEYIDSILALVSTSTDVEVDLGPLF